MEDELKVKGGPKAIMILETSEEMERYQAAQMGLFTGKFHNSITKTLSSFRAVLKKQDNMSYEAIFNSASGAILCALKIQSTFKYITPGFERKDRRLLIGISCIHDRNKTLSSLPEAREDAQMMCREVCGALVISASMKLLYREENKEAQIDKNRIRILRRSDLIFLKKVLGTTQDLMSSEESSTNDMLLAMDMTYPQLYSRLKRLTGKSPGQFMRDYRIKSSLIRFRQPFKSVATVANQCGFKSASYFSKCFHEHYGIPPSVYAQRHKLR